MPRRVVGLYYSPWTDGAVPDKDGSFAAKFRYAVWFKANPRDEEYMRRLFAQRHPGGSFVVAWRDPGWRRAVAGADQLVLLFPDAIGLGFRLLERQVRDLRKAGAEQWALNGRGREVVLDGQTRRALRLRRCMEAGMVAEIAALPVFTVLTVILLAVDLVRGRR